MGTLALLSPRQRQVVVLRYWLDLSVDETARDLGINRGTVKSHDRRGTVAYLVRTRNDRGEFVTVAFTAQDGPSTTRDPPPPAIEHPDVSVDQLIALATDPALTLP